MGVRFFTCGNCKGISSEYNEVYCPKCGEQLCQCAIPEELKKYIRIWEDVWEYVTTDAEDNFIPAEGCEEDLTELFSKYLVYDSYDWGLELKPEYCPICNKEKEFEKDPEYKEYLRLKEKFKNL